MYDDYRKLGVLPDVFHFEPVEATTLVFEDSMYDVSAADLVSYFEKTGALEAHGYMILPLEFYYPDMPDNELYQIRTVGDYVHFNYRYGQSNGYCHKASTWREFGLRQVVNGSDFDLFTEITGRFGPIVTYRITKTARARNVVRLIELPRQFQYVRMLDVWKSVNLKTGRINSPLVYFSVYAEEYYDALLWLASLAKDSRKIETVMTYVRRRKSGVSLQTKELVSPWHLQDSKVQAFCLTIWLQAELMSSKTVLIQENLGVTSVLEKYLAFVRKVGNFLLNVTGLRYLLDLLFSEHLTDKLVLFPDTSVQQWYNVDFSEKSADPIVASVPIFAEGKDRGDRPACPVCSMIFDVDIGDQKIKCEHREEVTTFAMTEADCQAWFAELADDDNDPVGLKAVKSFAKKNVPRQGFSHSLRVYHIKGKHGTGKSSLIRKLATERDLVLAPFSKLMADYTGLEDADGKKYDLLFKTSHRGLAQHGADRIFSDEFPSLDFRFTMAIAYLNQASELFLVGDMSQTQIQEPAEGWNIGNHLDLERLSTHTLMVNHRNRPDTNALMHHYFGDRLECRRPSKKSFSVVTAEEFPAIAAGLGVPVTTMAFSHNTFQAYDLGVKSTVRACQGGTYDYAALYVSNLDNNTAFVECLQRVAFTRHREML